MPILPDRGDAIRANREDVVYAGGGGVGQVSGKNLGVGGIPHFVVPASAFGARTASPHQGKGVKADMIVVPDD